MEKEQKLAIIQAVVRYQKEKGLSQGKLARAVGVNDTYISDWCNGKLEHEAQKGVFSEIGDANYIKAAKAIGFQLEKSYWEIEPTPQFIRILSALEDAQKNLKAKMIIGESGCGKTLSVDKFCEQNPKHALRITVNDRDSVSDIEDEIARVLGLTLSVRRGARLRKIGDELRERFNQGEKNVLIIDEAENTKVAGIKAYKAIYDMIKGYCGFVLIGTDELPTNIDRFHRYKKGGMTQFGRRFKAGTVMLPPVDCTFPQFETRVADTDLWNHLKRICFNYGELCDFLEPALKAADEDGVPLTLDYFKLIYPTT